MGWSTFRTKRRNKGIQHRRWYEQHHEQRGLAYIRYCHVPSVICSMLIAISTCLCPKTAGSPFPTSTTCTFPAVVCFIHISSILNLEIRPPTPVVSYGVHVVICHHKTFLKCVSGCKTKFTLFLNLAYLDKNSNKNWAKGWLMMWSCCDIASFFKLPLSLLAAARTYHILILW